MPRYDILLLSLRNFIIMYSLNCVMKLIFHLLKHYFNLEFKSEVRKCLDRKVSPRLWEKGTIWLELSLTCMFWRQGGEGGNKVSIVASNAPWTEYKSTLHKAVPLAYVVRYPISNNGHKQIRKSPNKELKQGKWLSCFHKIFSQF